MNAHAAGEGENPLQRGVGSPIHTPTLGGGDCHTFIPFTSPFLCTPLCLPPLFSPPRLIRIKIEQWGCFWGVRTLTASFLCEWYKWHVALSHCKASCCEDLHQDEIRMECECCMTTNHCKNRVKPDSVLLKYPCVCMIDQKLISGNDDLFLNMRLMIHPLQCSTMNLESKRAQLALSDTHQAVNYCSLATSQQTPC